MPRYFFDIDDGAETTVDETGVVCNMLSEISDAVGVLPDIARGGRIVVSQGVAGLVAWLNGGVPRASSFAPRLSGLRDFWLSSPAIPTEPLAFPGFPPRPTNPG
jgi:hypothetical protein